MKIKLFALITLFFCFQSFSQLGANDPTYNTSDVGNGKGDGANAFVYSSAIQTDGKILLGGNFTYYGGVDINRLARISANGYPDLTFNTGTGANDTVSAILVLSSGQIMVGGSFTDFNGTSINRLVRLNSNGSVDATFNIGTGFNNSIYSISVQSDGRLIVAGNFTTVNGVSKNRIVRLNTNGSIDATFNVGTGASSKILSTAIQSDGKVLICGTFTTYNGTTQNRITRLTTTGAIDAGFNIGTGLNTGGTAYDIEVQTDGKIVVGGVFGAYNGNTSPSFARINSDGTFDSSLSGLTSVSGSIRTILIQTDGKYVISGDFTGINGFVRNKLARLNTDGSSDTYNVSATGGPSGIINTACLQSNGYVFVAGEFVFYSSFYDGFVSNVNTSGVRDVNFNIPSAFDTGVSTMEVQSDNKIVAAGSFTAFNTTTAKQLLRLLPNGSLDATFTSGSGTNSGGNIGCLQIQTDGKIVIGGSFTSYGGASRSNIARTNSNGTNDATFTPGTGANNAVKDLAIQTDGKIIVGGWFTSYNGTSCSGLIRLNANGTIDGTFTIPTLSTASVYSIALQADGKIIIGGDFLTVNGTTVNRIARLNTDGSLDATFTTGSGANGTIYALCILNSGKLVVGGNFTTFNFSPYARIAMLNSNGTTVTSFNGSTAFNFAVVSIKELPDNNIAVAGSFTLFNVEHISYLTCIDKFGNRLLAYDFGTGPNRNISCMALQAGKLLIGGNFTNYQGYGRNRTARIMLCNPTTQTSSVASCNQYYWPVTGTTYTSSGLYIDTLTSAAGCDSILKLQLTIKHSSSSTTTMSVCDHITWNGNYYTNSGTYTYTTVNSVGCDSIANLNLTVRHSSSGIDVRTACDSLTWIDGNTYTSSTNLPTHTLTNAVGCDSVVTLHLTIRNSTTGIDYQTTCDTFTWIDGFTYFASTNTPTYTLTNAAGCDSIVTLNLTIKNSTTGTDIQTACNSYTWIDGNTYASSTNLPTFTLTNAVGCDSIVTLNLTILHSGTSSLSVSECDQYTWTNGVTYYSSGIYHDTLTGQNGCDSIATLELTIRNSYHDTLVVSNCSPYFWDFTQNTILFSGTYSHTLVGSNGCDSTQVLQILINNPPTATVVELTDGSLQETSGNFVLSWLNCSNNSPIASNNSIYTPTANGMYAAIVYDGTTGCSDTSNCVVVDNVGVLEATSFFVSLYPNPTNDLVTISFDGSEAKLTVYDAQGKLIRTSGIQSGTSVSLKDVQTGVYFFELITEQGSVVKRVVKN